MAIVPEYRYVLAGAEVGRLARRQPAQVALHAVRSERAVLPPHGRAAARVLARARVPAHDGDGAGEEPDGHGRPAWPPLPRAEAVDGAALLRRGRHPRSPRANTAASRACSRRGWTPTRTSRAWPTCRSAWSASAALHAEWRTRLRSSAQPAAAGCGERERRGVPLAHEAGAANSCFASPSAISARPRRTCGRAWELLREHASAAG